MRPSKMPKNPVIYHWEEAICTSFCFHTVSLLWQVCCLPWLYVGIALNIFAVLNALATS
jgi:hypothetical protein